MHFATRGHGRQQITEGVETKTEPVRKLPRVPKLMALSIRFDELIREGVVADQAELASIAGPRFP